MKVLIILIALAGFADIGRIARTNKLIRDAEKAFLAENYTEAIQKYRILIDSLNYQDETAVLNLANALYRNNQKDDAASYFNALLNSKDPSLKSAAYQQLGVLSYEKKEMEQALDYFRNSLRADPSNEDSRYNYELLRKAMQDNESQEQQKQEPSEYAKNLRRQAESLVQQGKYREAYQLMQKGLAVDQTVSAYQDFIKRTGDVAEIDERY